MIRISQLKLPITHTKIQLEKKIAKTLKNPGNSFTYEIKKQSLDCRHKNDKIFVYTIDVKIKDEQKIVRRVNNNNIMLTKEKAYEFPSPGETPLPHPPVIVGSGPAGLFCGWYLAKAGYCPIILERGEEADKRQKTVENFWKNGVLDPESNVQFGEGGAGTFSDGKLNTLVKDKLMRNRKVLEIFVEHGAPEEILYQQKPHIGTDVLKNVIVSMRKSILEYGGEVRFDSCMTDLDVRDGALVGIWVNQTEYIACETLVLATGHSARDTFAMLGKHIHMEPKSFAVGVRIEHPQEMINFSQYGAAHVSSLGAASYKLTHQAENGRGVYSFCMCPGGFVVNASSEKGGLAVNGMSYHARDSKNANSALIVTVTPQDFPDASYMGGVAFQRSLEQAAYRAGNSKIPLQLFGDFKEGRISTGLGEVKPCTKGAYAFADLNQVLPKPLTDALCEAIPAFDRKIHGFAREDALLLGVESRTSSPLRMVRDENGESNVRGLYPCGEGAGYAGGITSAAMDGIRAAEWIAARFCP
mgnify:CR=1 FL=1